MKASFRISLAFLALATGCTGGGSEAEGTEAGDSTTEASESSTTDQDGGDGDSSTSSGDGDTGTSTSTDTGDGDAGDGDVGDGDAGDGDAGDGDSGDGDAGDGDAGDGDAGDGDGGTGDGDGGTGDGDGDSGGDGESGGDGDGDGDGDQNCGNGVIDAGEQCDDANGNDDDDCQNDCQYPPSACGTQTFGTQLEIVPADIIISVDNSGSMGEEIIGVEDNINVNFVQIMENAGLDYRVIMVAEHGPANPEESICIEAPLSGIAQGGCGTPPAQPVDNPPLFYHYSTPIASHNMWCELLTQYPNTATDEFGKTGWGQYLRPEALKTFIGISDDGTNCSWTGGTFNDMNLIANGTTAAADWDAALLALDPTQFGTTEDRRYTYFSIVGMGANDPATDAWQPNDPVTTNQCPTGIDPGTGHQSLSVLTEGLRYPICNPVNYDAVFQGIANSVVANSPIVCELPLPVPPNNGNINLTSLEVVYTPGGTGTPLTLSPVAGLNACAADSYYIEDQTIQLCPATCTTVQGDLNAQIDLEYLCLE